MPDKIRVLIADDNEETRDGTRRLLEYEGDIEIIDFADNGAIAIQKVKELDPDIVLMDINMPVMDGLTATERLQQEAPRTQIIIVSVQDDRDYMRQAIRAGAADYVSKPISGEELAESIRRAYRRIPQQVIAPPRDERVWERDYERGAQGQVITVLGCKGGIGKTTLAVNIAVGLARADPSKKVVLVDANLYFGDVSIFLNTRGQYTIIDLLSMVVEEPDQLDPQSTEMVFLPHESGIKLLIGPRQPVELGSIPAGAVINLLTYLKTQFDYIVVDTSTTYDDVLAATIQSADIILLLVAATVPAIKDASILLAELTGSDLQEKVMLVMNQVDRNSRITPDRIEGHLKRPIVAQIPTDPFAIESINQSTPLITLSAQRAPSVRPLMNLVQLIKEKVEKSAAENEAREQAQRRGLRF
jgi:pilus assembly protein CpaE